MWYLDYFRPFLQSWNPFHRTESYKFQVDLPTSISPDLKTPSQTRPVFYFHCACESHQIVHQDEPSHTVTNSLRASAAQLISAWWPKGNVLYMLSSRNSQEITISFLKNAFVCYSFPDKTRAGQESSAVWEMRIIAIVPNLYCFIFLNEKYSGQTIHQQEVTAHHSAELNSPTWASFLGKSHANQSCPTTWSF